MFSTKEMPSPTSLFSAYASMMTTVMLIRSTANEIIRFIPLPLRDYLYSAIRDLFKSPPTPNILTLVIEESSGMFPNQVYEACEAFLCGKISPKTDRLKISKTSKENNLTVKLEKSEKVVDQYEGIQLNWRFVCMEKQGNNSGSQLQTQRKRWFEVSFDKKYKDKVLESYVPYFMEKAKEIKVGDRVLKMYTLSSLSWNGINFEHPATFETLAMEPELKKFIIEDLNRFVRRKEFYKKVGRAWKRGYLLYGPPGTGKSSLVAAMANYLKFNVYDLQLGNIHNDSELRRLLLSTGNKSILVIEDIDCSVELPDRVDPYAYGRKPQDVQFTLSGLLNFVDGLWSSCGDERIIIFTTNHKERLDPALLRPGRMDVHIHMSYCRSGGFKMLASNYLGIDGTHKLFGEIEGLLDSAEITPAEVAEELLKSEDADVALEGLVNVLKRKRLEGTDDAVGIQRGKRQQVD